MRSVSSVSIGFTWRAASQPFQQESSSFERQRGTRCQTNPWHWRRKSGWTKMQKKALHTAGLRPLSELENMGAGDTERTEGLANALQNIHTSIYINSLTFSHTLTSKWTLREIPFESRKKKYFCMLSCAPTIFQSTPTILGHLSHFATGAS